jgi:hypothetical protein
MDPGGRQQRTDRKRESRTDWRGRRHEGMHTNNSMRENREISWSLVSGEPRASREGKAEAEILR